MKKIFPISLFLFLLFLKPASGQWEKVADFNVGATGQMAMHGSTVFLYGYEGEQFVYRSTDNGVSWTNIADKFPDKVYFVQAHGNYVFAVVGVNGVYYSEDDGETWTSRSQVPLSNGAVLSLVSDGTILYAVSNRASVFKSEDNAATWNEIVINYTQAQVLGLDFAAVGNTMAFTAVNLGSFISTDGGANWTLLNPAIIIGTVHAFNNEIYGSTYGMYKLAADGTSSVSGFPSGIGVTASTKGTVSLGNKVFTYYQDVFTGGKIFSSGNNGDNWGEVDADLPSAATTSLNNFIAVTPQYIYCFIYSIFSPGATGVYRCAVDINTTAIKEIEGLPSDFSLSQNYPNPFNPATKINFSIPQNEFVSLKIFNAVGEQVAELVNQNLSAGSYSVDFTASALSSGIYFYNIHSKSFIQTKKMILLK